MTTSIERTLALAAAEVGYSRWNDPLTGTKYGRWYAQETGVAYFGANGVPYCAMFASNMLEMAGVAIPGGRFAYVPTGIANARKLGRLVPVSQAQPGDLLCFDWNRDGVADHIGFMVKWAGRGVFATIEGNTSPGTRGSQSNGGGVYRRIRSAIHVCAVIRPYYENAATPAPVSGVARLAVDGYAGPATITAAQQVAATPVDGAITGQARVNARYWPNLNAVRYGSGGSALVWAIQGWVRARGDGYLGPETIKGMQRELGVTQDGYMGPATVKAWQAWLNMKLGV